MANRNFYPAFNYGAGLVHGGFQFAAGGTIAPVAPAGVSGGDMVASFTHTQGTNVISVTMKDPFNLVIAADAVPRDDADSGIWCSTGTIGNEATSNAITFNINFFNANGSTVVDPASVVGVILYLRNTAAPESYQK